MRIPETSHTSQVADRPAVSGRVQRQPGRIGQLITGSLRNPGRMLAYAMLSLVPACSTVIPIQMPVYPAGKKGEAVRQVLAGKRNLAVVATLPSDRISRRFAYVENWSDLIEGKVSSEFAGRGYYRIIDLKSRKDRLREIAFSKLGITAEEKELGEELAVDTLLVLEISEPPRDDCKIEMHSSTMSYGSTALKVGFMVGVAVLLDRAVIVTDVSPERPTGVRYLSIYVNAKLVNVETGRAVTWAVTAPYSLQADPGDRNCPSVLKAFDGALAQLTGELADQLSPRMVEREIPLDDEAEDLSGSQVEVVERQLEDGVAWVKKGDFELAASSWESALEESRGKSRAALWNLATYYWYLGDYEQAEDYFKQAIRYGGPDWMEESERMNIWNEFKSERDLQKGAGSNGR